MAPEARPVSGRVVAITGGARGIGKATAKALTQRGAKVAIGDVDLELCEQTAREIGGETVALRVDVTRRDSFEDFVSAAEERLGPLDILINNAGIMPIGKPLDEEDDATAHRIVDINLHGVMYGTKIAMERMKRRRSGHIVNLASQAGKAGLPGGATYCATKHAVVGLSEAVRGELRDYDVEVSVVMPAVVNTELGSGLVETPGMKKVEPEDVAEAIAAALERPKFDVHVPASAAIVGAFAAILPRRAREAVARAMKADKVLLEPDEKVRASYEERAARSEPGLEPGSPAAKDPSALAEAVAERSEKLETSAS